ncbi:Endonuclease/exonuclease/phosphatase [Penicillium malachiteum]|uniref:Endonuclease/exonuclease/phosphatase n=1 Tax=Penicillium malachiteum TaxID=1324776 RepID=A0AAD6MPQ1_9EURO|nr:Endonuclease/exonuclease/phosphatase [Penicillium malachiteum]
MESFTPRANISSWINQTPVPPHDEGNPDFQLWHEFDPVQGWVSARWDNSFPNESINTRDTSNLTLVTWNIDAGAPRTRERTTEIINFITSRDPKVDIILLQEVSKSALRYILEDERIRESWISSEPGDSAWGSRPFSTMTLLSKSRFTLRSDSAIRSIARGLVWRVNYPSRFGRDALCCDLILPPRGPGQSGTRIRLANVHLDSLPIEPSYRPAQLSTVSSFLESAGCGLIAGDFNPVLPEDAILVESNGLTDAWKALHPNDPGFTWGVDGKQRFPPSRLDKVAFLGLAPHSIEVLEPQILSTSDQPEHENPDPQEELLWSDHHGLLCSFNLS